MNQRAQRLAALLLVLLIFVAIPQVEPQLQIKDPPQIEEPGLTAIESNVTTELDKKTGELTLSSWSDEAFFKIKMPVDPLTSVSLSQKDRLHYTHYTVDVYDVPLGIEYEVIFDSRPDTNTIIFMIETKNIAFHYQPPLDEEIFNKGFTVNATHAFDTEGNLYAYRPENIVGSYAVYHASKKGNDYGTGKMGHIYRPRIYDSAGGETWGNLIIYEDSGVLLININGAWLDNAVYPIRVDPTFGKTTIGGSSGSVDGGRIRGTQYLNLNGSGTLTHLWLHIPSINSPPKEFSLALYSDNGENMSTLIAQCAFTNTSLIGWNNLTSLNATAIVNNTKYWIAAAAEGWQVQASYDSVVGTGPYWWQAYGSWPAGPLNYPPSGGTDTLQLSAYATFTSDEEEEGWSGIINTVASPGSVNGVASVNIGSINGVG